MTSFKRRNKDPHMKALFLLEPAKTEIREIEKPTLAAEQVLVKVGKVGFCGGDLNAFRGVFPMQQYPMILGHEIGGVIEETAVGVPEQLQPGMRITVSPYKGCGRCSACANHRPNACRDNQTMGVMRHGAMTEYIAVPWYDIHVSSKLSLEELALVEPLAVGFHAVNRGRVSKTDTVLVIGCGIVGIGAVAGAAYRGADVIATDIDDKKLSLARKAGARHTINPETKDLHDFLASLTGGEGPAIVIEAVGRPETYRSAVDEVAFTGRVVYIGYTKAPVEYETKLFVQKELDILGSRNSAGEFSEVIKMMEHGGFPVDNAVSREVPLKNAGEALAAWNADPRGVIKIMVAVASSI
jgi:threonine dehydrogenase-like Zn-dependent dehydrogenase